MKKFFLNSTVAWILTVALCIASVVLNTRIRLGKSCDEVNSFFYTGNEEHYTAVNGESPVASELRKLCDAADSLSLLGIRADYDDLEDLSDAVSDIREELRGRTLDFDDLYEDYEELLQETFRLESALARAELSEEESASYYEAQHAAAEAKTAIDGSSYNKLAATIRQKHQHFPTTVIAALSGVHIPELFA